MHRSLMAVGPLAVLVGAAPLAACGTAGADADDGGADGGEFIAQASDFTGFCNWSSAPATNDADASDGIHGLGPLRVYWNHSPPHGSKTFPLGTIIVKESTQSDPTQRVVFAMVKRGDVSPGVLFNGSGAKGWEWWSLADNGDCTMTLLWRAAAAPAGETYANTSAGDCNGCHGQVASNDYVWDTALQLSNF